MKSIKAMSCLAFALAGCSGVPTIPNVTPYKIDIQQGNYVTQEMVAKLKPGMTRAQVRFALGTPLVADMFHNDRWDYVYVFRKGGEVTEHRRMTVIFKDDKLARLEGDVVPAKPGAKTPDAASKSSGPAPTAPASKASTDKSQVSSPPSRPSDANVTTTAAGAPSADSKDPGSAENKARTKASTEEKEKDAPAEEKGFFGRMLEKLGF